MPTIELHPAYLFDCTECGRETFLRAVVADLDEQDRLALVVRYGMPEHEAAAGGWMTRPDEVTCKHCGSQYTAIDRGDEPAPKE